MVKTTSCECNDYSKLIAKTGIGQLSAANSNRNGDGTLATVITGAANGTSVTSVKIIATAPTTMGMVRLFVGTLLPKNISLFAEIPVPACGAGGGTLSMFDATLNSELVLQNGSVLPESLPPSRERSEDLGPSPLRFKVHITILPLGTPGNA